MSGGPAGDSHSGGKKDTVEITDLGIQLFPDNLHEAMLPLKVEKSLGRTWLKPVTLLMLLPRKIGHT